MSKPSILLKDTKEQQAKFSLFGIGYNAVDYEKATSLIIDKAISRQSYGVSALAVHGLVEGYRNDDFGQKINQIDLVVPDGQPVRWALNSFYDLGMSDRVYGPTLTLEVLKKANEHAMRLFLYGSTHKTLTALAANIAAWFPRIELVGMHEDRFREATPEEDRHDIEKINASGAHIVLVGRGCPRQEIWVSDHLGKIDAVMMAVGAAFDFHAGRLKQAPRWMQDAGLEWLFRLTMEPRRLWKRYAVTNSYFIYLLIKKKCRRN
jgi:exopolysaccharide biosynthesis WecB/TagA/CpsF family protein